MRAWEWVLVHWPTSWRRRVAYVVAIVVFVLAALPLVVRIAGAAVDLGILPYSALVILCWVGEGGLLVPIPGVRLLSWLTIIQQGANLEPVLVAMLAAVAMACGQSSYFLIVQRGSKRVLERLSVGPLKGHVPIPTAAPDGATSVVPDPSLKEPEIEVPTAPSQGRLATAAASIQGRLRAHPRRTVFAVSVLPSPLTTLTTVGAASASVPFRIFFGAALAGFLVLSSVLAFAGQAILTFVAPA